MADGYAIELHFDPALDDQIVTAWNRLGRLSNRPESSFKPRKILFISPDISNPAKLERALRRFAATHRPFPLYFNLIAANATTIATAPSQSLLGFHHQLYDALMDEGLSEFNAGTFRIYDSMAEGVSDMDRAFAELGDLIRVSGSGAEIWVVGYMPYGPPQVCFSCPLGGARSRL